MDMEELRMYEQNTWEANTKSASGLVALIHGGLPSWEDGKTPKVVGIATAAIHASTMLETFENMLARKVSRLQQEVNHSQYGYGEALSLSLQRPPDAITDLSNAILELVGTDETAWANFAAAADSDVPKTLSEFKKDVVRHMHQWRGHMASMEIINEMRTNYIGHLAPLCSRWWQLLGATLFEPLSLDFNEKEKSPEDQVFSSLLFFKGFTEEEKKEALKLHAYDLPVDGLQFLRQNASPEILEILDYLPAKKPTDPPKNQFEKSPEDIRKALIDIATKMARGKQETDSFDLIELINQRLAEQTKPGATPIKLNPQPNKPFRVAKVAPIASNDPNPDTELMMSAMVDLLVWIFGTAGLLAFAWKIGQESGKFARLAPVITLVSLHGIKTAIHLGQAAMFSSASIKNALDKNPEAAKEQVIGLQGTVSKLIPQAMGVICKYLPGGMDAEVIVREAINNLPEKTSWGFQVTKESLLEIPLEILHENVPRPYENPPFFNPDYAAMPLTNFLDNIQGKEILVETIKGINASYFLEMQRHLFSIETFLTQLPFRLYMNIARRNYAELAEIENNRVYQDWNTIRDNLIHRRIFPSSEQVGGVIHQFFRGYQTSQFGDDYSSSFSIYSSTFVIFISYVLFELSLEVWSRSGQAHLRQLSVIRRVFRSLRRPVVDTNLSFFPRTILNTLNPRWRFRNTRDDEFRGEDYDLQLHVFVFVAILYLIGAQSSMALGVVATVYGSSFLNGLADPRRYYKSFSDAIPNFLIVAGSYLSLPIAFFATAAIAPVNNQISWLSRRTQVKNAELTLKTLLDNLKAANDITDTSLKLDNLEAIATEIKNQLEVLADNLDTNNGSERVSELLRQVNDENKNNTEFWFRVSSILAPLLLHGLKAVDDVAGEKDLTAGTRALRSDIRRLYGKALLVNRLSAGTFFGKKPYVLTSSSGKTENDSENGFGRVFAAYLNGNVESIKKTVKTEILGEDSKEIISTPQEAFEIFTNAMIYRSAVVSVKEKNRKAFWARLYSVMAQNGINGSTPTAEKFDPKNPEFKKAIYDSLGTSASGWLSQTRYENVDLRSFFTPLIDKLKAGEGIHIAKAASDAITAFEKGGNISFFECVSSNDLNTGDSKLDLRIKDRSGFFALQDTHLAGFITQLIYSSVVNNAIDDDVVLNGYTLSVHPGYLTNGTTLDNTPPYTHFYLVYYILTTYFLDYLLASPKNNAEFYLVALIIGHPVPAR